MPRFTWSVPFVVAACVACEPAIHTAHRPDERDGVPANSASELRLRGERTGGLEDAGAVDHREDPGATRTVPLGVPTALTTSAVPAPVASGKPAAKGRVPHAECEKLFDRYLELALGADALAEVSPEVIAEAKATARGQKGDPCKDPGVTRPQFDCAMRAGSTADWGKCLK